MNTQMKRRMAIVGGVIVIVVILLLAFLGGNSSAKVATVTEVASGAYEDTKVQVTGVVVDNSFSIDSNGTLSFDIAAEDDAAQQTTLHVTYDKGASSTFGNGVTAICTGRMDEDGTLSCTELVTKCPSKYENASEALTVTDLLGYDFSNMGGKTVKVTGYVSSIGDATADVRFMLTDEQGNSISADQPALSIVYAGALSDGVTDGAKVVVTGSLTDEEGGFKATEVALSE